MQIGIASSDPVACCYTNVPALLVVRTHKFSHLFLQFSDEQKLDESGNLFNEKHIR